MFNLLYDALFVVSFLILVMMINKMGNRISIYHVMLFVTIVLADFGYMQLSDAVSLRAAVVANQTIYLGAIFSAYFLLMCVSDLCRIRIGNIIRLPLIAYGVFIFYLISNTDNTKLYYKGLYYIKGHGVGNLVKIYGPLHTLYPVYFMTIICIGIGIIIYAIKKKKDVALATSTMLLFLMVLVVVVYVLERVLKLDYAIMPFAYLIGQIGIYILLRRITMYSIAAITADSMMGNEAYGFVILDQKGRYLGSDETAKGWFPELVDLYVDQAINNPKSELLIQINKWVKGNGEHGIKHFDLGDVYIKCEHVIIREHETQNVHAIYLVDETQSRKYTKLVEQYNENLEHDVNEKTERIRNIQDDIIISMASIVENRDNNTGGHIKRTSDIMKIFVKHLQKKESFEALTPEIAKCIIKAAPLHDFGKIGVPDIILNKPGKFTDEEYKQMQTHPDKGAIIVERILQSADDLVFKNIAINVAHYHHEKWDGKGYPTGISGFDIPFEARIMALADVFDALVSKRVYKEKFSYDKAFSIIEESCGTHFDPVLCKEFMECRPQLEALYDSYVD